MRQTWRGGATWATLTGLALLATACGGSDDDDDGTQTAQARCAAVARANLPVTAITRNELIAADTTRPTGITTGPTLPEHCLVQGKINERTGVDGNTYAIGFELRLPTDWNGKFFYQGGGGNDGSVREAVGANTGVTGRQDNALLRGYAVVSTDAGHTGGGPEFALDPLARVDHAYNAHDRTAVTAKSLIEGYYGRQPDRSYFVGCSGGGRQGMMFSQRFPSYFDGVIAVAPAMRVAKGASISVANFVQQMSAIAPTDGSGNPILSQALSDGDLTLLADGIKAACDASDGLADGLVSDPVACSFDPGVLQCAGAKDATCLSAPQVTALRNSFAGPRNSANEALYFPWAWDPGIAAPAWRAWVLGSSTTATSDARYLTLMQGAVGYEFITPPQTDFQLINFDFDTDPARMDAFNSIYETGSDVALTAFKARSGKLLMFHGMADGIFAPAESMDYHDRLAVHHGGREAAQAFARLFLVPGMNHCSGGPATDAFDGLTALEQWVEQGVAPTAVTASGSTTLAGVSRPLCPYPQHAHYKGSGDTSAASSFECR